MLATIWMSTRPYRGIFHDATLYTTQALHSIYPDRFGNDLFFKYGSQDSFSIFTALYKPLVMALGISHANMLADILGQILWFASLLWLLTAIFPERKHRMVAALGAFLL